MKIEEVSVSKRVSFWIDSDMDLTIEDNFFDQVLLNKEEAIKLAELILEKYKQIES